MMHEDAASEFRLAVAFDGSRKGVSGSAASRSKERRAFARDGRPSLSCAQAEQAAESTLR